MTNSTRIGSRPVNWPPAMLVELHQFIAEYNLDRDSTGYPPVTIQIRVLAGNEMPEHDALEFAKDWLNAHVHEARYDSGAILRLVQSLATNFEAARYAVEEGERSLNECQRVLQQITESLPEIPEELPF
jgi:hypothetical protein